MDRPNKIAKYSTGAKASIGPPLPMPSASAPQPDWKIATMTPNDAPAAKRFIGTVVSCTSRLRNAIVGSRYDNSTTAPMKYGILLDST